MSTNKNELNVLTAADMTAAQLELEADAVIIGSGAGGGINAYELAKAGKKVIVLEAGRIAERGAHAELWQQGGYYAALLHASEGTGETESHG